MNELMVYTGNTVSLEKYDSIDKGSLVISEVRKTEKAQEEEKASVEASKSKEEERKDIFTRKRARTNFNLTPQPLLHNRLRLLPQSKFKTVQKL